MCSFFFMFSAITSIPSETFFCNKFVIKVDEGGGVHRFNVDLFFALQYSRFRLCCDVHMSVSIREELHVVVRA